jgi:hypothetical protein
MPYELKDLIVDRVDLVDEGANSAAFIELYKRKETTTPMDFEEILSKMKPEHAEVVLGVVKAKDEELTKARGDLESANQNLADAEGKLNAANEELAKANTEIETLKAKDEPCDCDGEADENGNCKSCGKPKKKAAAFDETETLKSMPEAARELFLKMRAQKEAAEEQIRKANEEKLEAEAIAKAASLKAIPVEQSKLVDILKSCSPEVAELLETINKAIETTVLEEVGKNAGNGAAIGKNNTSDEAWNKLEQKADEIAKRDNVTKEKAMSTALSENPELYREYLNGGAK